jgi:hypothetical protein
MQVASLPLVSESITGLSQNALTNLKHSQMMGSVQNLAQRGILVLVGLCDFYEDPSIRLSHTNQLFKQHSGSRNACSG